MKSPKGLRIKGANNKTHCLKILKNIYSQKHVGRLWYQYLVQGLLNICLSNQILIKIYSTGLVSFYFSMLIMDDSLAQVQNQWKGLYLT